VTLSKQAFPFGTHFPHQLMGGDAYLQVLSGRERGQMFLDVSGPGCGSGD
jgi:hypothetical protein